MKSTNNSKTLIANTSYKGFIRFYSEILFNLFESAKQKPTTSLIVIIDDNEYKYTMQSKTMTEMSDLIHLALYAYSINNYIETILTGKIYDKPLKILIEHNEQN